MNHILYCSKCNRFTLEEHCPLCKQPTQLPQPPKYSPEDPYARYRREAKLQERKARGWL